MIGVIGAGTMGCGVAQILACYGYKVVLLDLSQEILEQAKKQIYNITRFSQLTKKSGKKIDEIVANITYTLDYSDLADADFIIENVNEDYKTKEQVYKMLEENCKSEAVYIVNTSCISITKIGSITKRPTQVIGAHFMNPVAYINSTEVIIGMHTSDETLGKTKELLESIGKEAIIVQDAPGFVSNRISHLMMNEAAFIVQEQNATVEAVDAIFKQCFGHKMGPLETADLIGIDTVVDSLDVLFESYKDPKFRCCPLLRKMVAGGKVGRKSGEGFYVY